MTTETISGKCPCCGYNKMVQYYDSACSNFLEGCANCGFGYSDNYWREHDQEPDLIGTKAWMGLAIHWLASHEADKHGSREKAYEYFMAMDEMLLRRLIFDFIDGSKRHDDVETTLLKYSPEDIASYRATNPIIFKAIPVQ